MYEHDHREADREPTRVEGDVERRRVAALHEVLVQLVGRRVEDSDRERERHPAERPIQERAEDRVLGQVRALAQDRVPRSEAGRKARDRREREDDGGPDEDGKPDGEESRSGHRRPMLVSGHKPASGKGIRCKSGTVPPL